MTRLFGSSNTMAAVALAVALLAVSGSSQAQQTPSVTATAPAPGGSRRTLTPPTAAEQGASVRAVLQRAAVLSQRISQMLEEARRESDIIRVTCLNDKLTQVNANMRTAQSRLTAFENSPDADQRNHEATVLSVLGQKFQVLDQEANRCVGQDLYETGSTKVQTDIDTAMLPFEDDVATPPAPPPPAVPSLPSYASSFR